MMKRGIVNVRMVITEEKILSNIEKIHKLINPNNKKQIIELEDNSYFKDLVESVKTYLIEYPKKKNFPKNVYDQCYELVEYATKQFEENTKQIEDLIKEREYNIKSAAILKQTKEIVESGDPSWKQSVKAIQPRFSRDIIQSLSLIATVKEKDPENYNAAVKLVNARIDNLQSNLHIEIDMERIEDRSRALSFIGIEIADALKQIPVPRGVEEDSSVVENAQENLHIEEKEVKQEQAQEQVQTQVQAQAPVQTMAQVSPTNSPVQRTQVQNNQQQVEQQRVQAQQIAAQRLMQQRQMQQRQAFYNNMYANQMRQTQYQYAQYRQNVNGRVAMSQPMRNPSAQYMANYYNPRQNRQAMQQDNRQQVQKVQARPEALQQVDYTSRVYQNAKEIEDGRNIKVKSSLWNKFMNSKFMRSIKYAFKLRVVLQLPEGDEATANNK